jgi:hypothetical protein
MRDAGLAPDLCFEGGFEFEAGYNAALRMMAAGPLPDAVVGVNDGVAIGVLTGLRQAAGARRRAAPAELTPRRRIARAPASRARRRGGATRRG